MEPAPATSHSPLPWWEAPLLLLGCLLLALGNDGLIVGGLGMIAAVGTVRLRKAGRAPRISGPIATALGAILVGSAIGLLASHTPEAARSRIAAVIAGTAAFGWLVATVNSPARLRRACQTLLLVCSLGCLALLALIRGSLPDSLLTRLLAPLLTPFAQFPGISGDVLDVNSRFPVHQYGLAYLLLLMLPYLAAVAALGTQRHARRMMAAVGIVVIGTLIAATEARSALLAAALALALVASFRSRWLWLLLPAGAALLLVLLSIGIISRSIETDWLVTRLSIWTRTLNLLSTFPLTGSGLGMQAFAEVFAWTFALPNPYQVVHSHNIFLQGYAEQGLPGLIGLLLFFSTAMLYAWQSARRADPEWRWAATGTLGALAATLLYGLTDQVPTTNLGFVIVASLGALSMASSRWVDRSAIPGSAGLFGGLGRGGRRTISGLVIAAVLLLLIGLVPRWASALAMNNGEIALVAVVLGRDLPPGRRSAALDHATSSLTRSVEWNPSSVPALRELARARLLSNDVGGARAALDAATATRQLNDYERTQLGRLYLAMGLYPQAFALWIDAGQSDLLKQAANDFFVRRDYRAAAAAHAALIELDPDAAEHYANLAKVLLAGPLPGVDEAMRWFDHATQLKPDARRSLARQMVLQGEDFRLNERRCDGQPERAIFWFTLGAQIDPSFDKPEVELGSVKQYWAQCLERVGSSNQVASLLAESVAHFSRATQLDPRNGSSWKQLGDALDAAGRAGEAVIALEQARQLVPRDARVAGSLGRALAHAGRCEEARAALAEALRLDPGNSVARAEIERLGSCH